jgi:hypothetical protein
MAENSDVFLVRGSLQLIEPGMAQGETRTLVLTATTGTSQSWIVDGDYHIIGWAFIGNTGNAWGVFLDTTTAANIFGGAANQTTLDVVIIGGRSAATGVYSMMTGVNIPVRKNSRIYLNNGTAVTQTVTLYLNHTV